MMPFTSSWSRLLVGTPEAPRLLRSAPWVVSLLSKSIRVFSCASNMDIMSFIWLWSMICWFCSLNVFMELTEFSDWAFVAKSEFFLTAKNTGDNSWFTELITGTIEFPELSSRRYWRVWRQTEFSDWAFVAKSEFFLTAKNTGDNSWFTELITGTIDFPDGQAVVCLYRVVYYRVNN